MRASKDHSQIAMETYIWDDPLFPFQSNFHLHHSTRIALIKTNNLQIAKSNSQYVVVIFLYLSLPSDPSDHSFFLEFFFIWCLEHVSLLSSIGTHSPFPLLDLQFPTLKHEIQEGSILKLFFSNNIHTLANVPSPLNTISIQTIPKFKSLGPISSLNFISNSLLNIHLEV